jgi:hypothetical protein
MPIKIVVSDVTLIYKNRHYLIGATTFSKVTLGMMTLSIDSEKGGTPYIINVMLSGAVFTIMLSAIMLSVIIKHHYVEFCYAECH